MLIFLSLSRTNNVQLQTDAVLSQSRSANPVAAQRGNSPTVLTYQNGSSYSSKRDQHTLASVTAKESVYGVVKTNSAGSVR